MEKFKAILKKIFFLPPLPTVLIAVPSFVLMILALAFNINNALAYVAYTLAAYSMVIVITVLPKIARGIRKSVKSSPITQKIYQNPLIKKFLDDVMLRTKFSLYQGFFINILYIGIKLFSGIYYNSLWFFALSFYYILLAVMRVSLLNYVNTHKSENDISAEFRRYRLCGIMLLAMNAALAVIVVFMVKQDKGFEYSGLLIYAMALYSFYSVIMAVMNVVKFRKHNSPVMSAAKAINLVAAMVSILSLETAMVSQFGGDDDSNFRQIMTGVTGGGVCVIVLGMAIFMIVRSSINLKKIRLDNNDT
ncbi:MAG: hypothetical protein J1F04_09275 [Oscillospiraceae bacterium]|nr:hypothetical protein [Oscillospiraceae bacterium]